MARSNEPHAETVYGAAGHWVDAALRGDESLFTWGSPVWTLDALDSLFARLGTVDTDGGETLVDALAKALVGASPEIIQLAGEAMAVHLLIPVRRSLGGEIKMSMIEMVLGWSPYLVDIPGDVALALDDGLAVVGPDFQRDGVDHLRLIIDAVRSWKRLDPTRQEQLLAEPWDFGEWLGEIRPGTADAQRHALLHLVHPDTFEPIVVGDVKRRIVEAFAGGVAGDIDRQLFDIRRSLEATRTPGFSFSDPKIRSEWDVDTTPWGTLVHFIEIVRGAHAYETHEIDAVTDLSNRVAQVRRALDRGEPWVDSLAVALATATHPGLADAADRLLGLTDDAPDRVETMLRTIWSDAGTPANRLGIATDDLEVGALLLAASNPTATPPYLASAHDAVATLVDEVPEASDGAAARYEAYLTFLDRVVAESAHRGVDVPNRLAAVSAMWAVTQVPVDELTGRRHIGSADVAALEAYRGAVQTGSAARSSAPVETHSDLGGLAHACLVDEDWLAGVVRLLEHRHQILLAGPTGAGKSHLAQHLARYIAGPAGGVETLQFHPGVGYAEMVEGPKPDPSGRGVPQVQPGVLRRLVARASTATSGNQVLVIDDAGRGDLLAALGEVYALLGDRDRSVLLRHSGTELTLPANTYLILTSSDDRPLADAPLRRRFPTVVLHPSSVPLQGLLGRYLHRHHPEMAWLADVVDRANARIGTPEGAIAPGHFLGVPLDEDVVSTIWAHVVVPAVADLAGAEVAATVDLDDLRAAT